MRKTRVAIVGAGVAGLSAAALLSRKCDVTVLERADAPGGKIRQVQIGNEAIDSGPTVFTMREVFEDIFARAGADLYERITMRKLTTLARHVWTDGSRLDLFADLDRSAREIARFASERDARQFRAFAEKGRRIYETLLDPFMKSPRPSMASLLLKRSPVSLLGIDPYASLWRSLCKRFADPRLRQLFARYATYCGSSPFEAPATLMLIAHVEQKGVWTIDGGMQSLANALETVAIENGASFSYDAHVDRIENDRTVYLADGGRIDADVVIVNADVAAVSKGLLGGDAARAIGSAATRVRSQSAMTWCMRGAVSGLDLSVHNVFFSDDYEAEFDAVFRREALPEAPTTYLFAPERDQHVQPIVDGAAERLFFLTNAPAVGDRRTFTEREIKGCETRMLTHLRRCGLTVEPQPETTVATTPNDFERRFPGTGGALFGAANHGWRASFQRPSIRTRMKGLYLAGGSAHPGSGVPMAALSGAMAANCIMKDCGLI